LREDGLGGSSKTYLRRSEANDSIGNNTERGDESILSNQYNFFISVTRD